MLELKNISVITEDNRAILSDINLKIEIPSFTVITGPNGSGKSTLSKVIAGIMKPAEGQILLNNEDITRTSVTQRAKMGIGFAFQQPVRFKGITVRQIISLAAGRKLEIKEVCAYLRDVGLCANDYVNREIDASLSGGEIKRIELATIMARDVKISIFDEPEAGIDLWGFKNLINVFERLRNNANKAIIIISHQERILNIADKIILMSEGKIKETGKKETMLPALFAVNECRLCERPEVQ